MFATKYKVKPTLNVNIRRASRVPQEYIIGELPPGFVIDVVAEEKGDTYMLGDTESNIWLRDVHGFYYWKEGVTEVNPSEVIKLPRIPYKGESFLTYIENRFADDSPVSMIDYRELLQLEGFSPASNSHPVLVGVLDDPISIDLPMVKTVRRFSGVIPPAASHGTALAGLIGGGGLIKGIGAALEIVEMPMYNSSGYKDHQLLLNAINNIDRITSENKNMRIVVNISMDIDQDDIWTGLISRLLENKSVLLVASAGTDSELAATDDKLRQYPALLEDVIAVGSITHNYRKLNSQLNFHKRLTIALPDFEYPTYVKERNKFRKIGEDSSATAIVSGIIALFAQDPTTVFSYADIKQKLIAHSKPYSRLDSFHQLNLINPFL